MTSEIDKSLARLNSRKRETLKLNDVGNKSRDITTDRGEEDSRKHKRLLHTQLKITDALLIF